MERALRYLFVLACAAFFAVMWGQLLKRNLDFGARSGFRFDYASLLRPDEQERTTQWTVTFRGLTIGRSEMEIRRVGEGQIRISSNTELKVGPVVGQVFGASGDLDLQFRASVSPLRGLQSVYASSDALDLQVQGVVNEGTIILNGSAGGELVNTRVPFDEDQTLSDALSPMAALPELNEAREGESWDLRMLNPLIGSVQEVRVTVMGATEAEIEGRTRRVLHLRFSTGANSWSTLALEDGEVISQGTPFGVTFRRADLPADLMRRLRSPGTED